MLWSDAELGWLCRGAARAPPWSPGLWLLWAVWGRVLLSWLGVGWQNPSLPFQEAQKKGRSMAQFKHAMRFPKELVRGSRAQEKQTLICIYIHSPYIFLVSQGMCWWGEGAWGDLSSHPEQHSGPNAMHCLHHAGCLLWLGCPVGLRRGPGVFRHSPQEPWLLQDKQNSSILNNHILGAFLQNRTVTGLVNPVAIQFWHNMVLVSRAPLWAPVMLATAKLWRCGGSPTLCFLLSWER